MERGRAWHWRKLPSGWFESAFAINHGQRKTKRAFLTFFPGLRPHRAYTFGIAMRVQKNVPGETPLSWEAVKTVFTQNPSLKKIGVLAGAQALVNEQVDNVFGRYSFDVDIHTSGDLQQVQSRLTPAERKRVVLVSRANSEMHVYEVQTSFGTVKLEIARPFLPPKRRPVASKSIPGLKLTHIEDLIDAKISAISSRGFARDLVDLYTVHTQRRLNIDQRLLRASREETNDYNPIELENNLQLIERELREGKADLPCAQPPDAEVLQGFIGELRAINNRIARSLLRSDDPSEDSFGEIE